MTLHGIDKLSPELRETRLRSRLDEVSYLLTKRTRENRELRDRVERHRARIEAMRRDQSALVEKVDRLERQLAREQAERETR